MCQRSKLKNVQKNNPVQISFSLIKFQHVQRLGPSVASRTPIVLNFDFMIVQEMVCKEPHVFVAPSKQLEAPHLSLYPSIS